MKVAFLSGFKVFGNYAANSTEQLVSPLQGTIVQDHIIHSLVFSPAIFPPDQQDYGRQIVSRAMELQASVIVSFGMASAVNGLRIESKAVNWVENKTYCHAGENERLIDESLPKQAALMIDLQRWDINKLYRKFGQNGIPFQFPISQDAGTYCCNALIFRTLQAMQDLGFFIPYLFVHISCTKAAVQTISDFDQKKVLLSEEQLKNLVSIILTSYR
ncbi:MAG: hypothetical protein WC508_05505 [Patescibacteria group bacterium]